MSEEEKEAIEYFEHKIKNKLPLYEETYVDGKPYRRNILQLETNFTEEQANKTEILLNLIDKLKKENEDMREELQMYVDTPINKLIVENEELKEQRDNAIKLRNELIEEQKITCISKNKIIGKIKELEEKDKASSTNIYGYGIKFLKELLGE